MKNESLASLFTLAALCMIFLQQSWISVAGSPTIMEAELLKATKEQPEEDLYMHMRTCRRPIAWLSTDH